MNNIQTGRLLLLNNLTKSMTTEPINQQNHVTLNEVVFEQLVQQDTFDQVFPEEKMKAFDNNLSKAILNNMSDQDPEVEQAIQKAKRDRSHLVQITITDKRGHKRKVWVKPKDAERKKETDRKLEESKNKKAASDSQKTSSSDSKKTIGDKLLERLAKKGKDFDVHLGRLNEKTKRKILDKLRTKFEVDSSLKNTATVDPGVIKEVQNRVGEDFAPKDQINEIAHALWNVGIKERDLKITVNSGDSRLKQAGNVRRKAAELASELIMSDISGAAEENAEEILAGLIDTYNYTNFDEIISPPKRTKLEGISLLKIRNGKITGEAKTASGDGVDSRDGHEFLKK